MGGDTIEKIRHVLMILCLAGLAFVPMATPLSFIQVFFCQPALGRKIYQGAPYSSWSATSMYDASFYEDEEVPSFPPASFLVYAFISFIGEKLNLSIDSVDIDGECYGYQYNYYF